jgi:hypothetical protein
MATLLFSFSLTSSFFRKTSLQRNCLYATTPEIHWPFSIGTPYAPHFIQTMKKAIILAALLASVTASQAYQLVFKQIDFQGPGTEISIALGETLETSTEVFHLTGPNPPGLTYAFANKGEADFNFFADRFFDGVDERIFFTQTNPFGTETISLLESEYFAGSGAPDLKDIFRLERVFAEGSWDFGFATLTTEVPDAGATAVLLGFGIAGLALARRRLR